MKRIAVLLLSLLLGPSGSLVQVAQARDEAPAGPALFEADALPVGWSLTSTRRLPDDAAQGIGARLGVELEGVWVQQLDVNGLPVTVNVVRPRRAEDAGALHEVLVRMRGSAYVLRDGSVVREVVGTMPLLARRVFAAAGHPVAVPTEAVFRLGLVASGPSAELTPLYQLFLALTEQAADVAGRIRAQTEDWTLAEEFPLQVPEGMVLTAEPPAREVRLGSRLVHHVFGEVPTEAGVPYATFTYRGTLSGWTEPEPGRVLPEERGPTPAWPADDEAIVARARELAPEGLPARERLRRLLRFVALDIRYDGPAGSRHGVRRTLADGFGRCWDKSDLLITLCRAAGMPARQVLGWVPPLDAGHVWAEVHLEGEGWLAVDATCPWTGISGDYLPLRVTRDGEAVLLYVARPRIRRLP